MEKKPRNYSSIRTTSGDWPIQRRAAMQQFVDRAWDALHDGGVSWIGFYLPCGPDEMVLGPRRDKPACSPIGMHGACGVAYRERRELIVKDVGELGDRYIACDPRDRSELVIPLFEASDECWGVLDVDSFDLGAFDEADLAAFKSLLKQAGLTA